MKKIAPTATFNENQTLPGTKVNGKILKGGSHPPKKRIADNALISNMFEYSARKNRANVIAEYSTLYPETNSASASGKSKGCLLVSANIEI